MTQAASDITEPAPLVDTTELIEIADGVWIIPDHRVRLVPNIGIIIGSTSVLVVDTGMGPANAAGVLAKARELAGERQIFLTVTHFHPEHGFGAQVFKGVATIVYNRTQRDELRDKGAAYLGLFSTFSPGVVACLEGVELVEPDIVYDGSLTLDLGGREVVLLDVGPAHTRGDQLVWLPEEKIVFAGDLLETAVFPIFPYFPPDDTDVDGNKWIAVLRRISALDPRVVVTGHCDIGGPELITVTEEYLLDMGARTDELRRSGLDEDAVVAELEQATRSAYPGWREPEWIERGIRCFCASGFSAAPAGRGGTH